MAETAERGFRLCRLSNFWWFPAFNTRPFSSASRYFAKRLVGEADNEIGTDENVEVLFWDK